MTTGRGGRLAAGVMGIRAFAKPVGYPRGVVVAGLRAEFVRTLARRRLR